MTNGANFFQYMSGWHAGAGCKSIDKDRSEHKDKDFARLYLMGWQDGKNASRLAADSASEKFGYTQAVIRTMEYEQGTENRMARRSPIVPADGTAPDI